MSCPIRCGIGGRRGSNTTVYFATNRRPDPTKPGGYGAEIVEADPAQVTYAVVPVTGVNTTDESSGQLGEITAVTPGDFAQTVQAEIETTGRNLLVFIHGFDNSFEDAIKRSAFNREWFAASGHPAADTTVLAFTWPSAGELIANLPNLPDAAYRADLAMAARSDVHLAAFLGHVLGLVAIVRNSGRRAFLLAHSMGNHALACAMQTGFAGSALPASPFNEAVLAAADEVDTTLYTPGSGMYGLRTLADRISVYSSVRDIAMGLSMAVNRNKRLGYDGPVHKQDSAAYPRATFRSVDCTEVFDFSSLIPPDATHQYYRRSKKVREDIAKLMGNEPVSTGVSSLSALPFGV